MANAKRHRTIGAILICIGLGLCGTVYALMRAEILPPLGAIGAAPLLIAMVGWLKLVYGMSFEQLKNRVESAGGLTALMRWLEVSVVMTLFIVLAGFTAFQLGFFDR